MSSFSPVLRVRKFLDKMKTERGGEISPVVGRLKRSPPSRSSSSDLDSTSGSPQTKLGRKGSQSGSLQSHSQFMEMSFDGEKYESHFLSEVFKSLNTEKENHFNYLPHEAILSIFSFLDAKTLLTLRYVSTEFCGLADDDLTWKHLCIQELGAHVTLVNCNWKTTYLILESIFSEGEWRGFSKWVDPPTFDNEQKTSARLNFLKKATTQSNETTSAPGTPTLSSFRSPSRSNSTSSESSSAQFPSITPTSSYSSTTSSSFSSPSLSRSGNGKMEEKEEKMDSPFKILGTGITINCESPSPFGISGERITMDGEGMKFKWNKNFDRHTSVYDGYMNYKNRTVEGTISYNDGHTHWKGIFHYTKCAPQPIQKKNIIKKKSSKLFF